MLLYHMNSIMSWEQHHGSRSPQDADKPFGDLLARSVGAAGRLRLGANAYLELEDVAATGAPLDRLVVAGVTSAGATRATAYTLRPALSLAQTATGRRQRALRTPQLTANLYLLRRKRHLTDLEIDLRTALGRTTALDLPNLHLLWQSTLLSYMAAHGGSCRRPFNSWSPMV